LIDRLAGTDVHPEVTIIKRRTKIILKIFGKYITSKVSILYI
jgi:hypothetical protein